MKEEKKTVVARGIGRATAVWGPETNRYVLIKPPADEAAKLVAEGLESSEIVDFCMSVLELSEEQAVELECQLREALLGQAEAGVSNHDEVGHDELFNDHLESGLYSEKFYRLFGRVFRVGFATMEAEFSIHPKFTHLETRPRRNPDHYFVVNHHKGLYALQVDGEPVGAWPKGREHIFSGQFSMQMLEKAYQKQSDNWMAVLHAAGISDGSNCLAFAGDTGAGKSTLSALLMARGMDVLADDFLPVEGDTGMVCHFPAAISVKKDACGVLSSAFPELERTQVFHCAKVNKTVRYLPVDHDNGEVPRKMDCRGLVFVNYEPDGGGCRLEELPPEEAFARLVPDAWIYPSRENARHFLEWFSRLKCFRLTYSENEKMVKTINSFFKTGLN